MSLKLNTASGGSITLQEADTASNLTLTVPAQAGSIVTADSSGNVGIGTSSPATKLEIVVPATNSYTNGITLTNSQNWGWGSSLSFKTILTDGGSLGDAARITQSYESSNNYTLEFATTNSGTLSTKAKITAAGNLQFNSGYGSVATAYGCRAWVNFNGTGTVAIRASGNVSSITDRGVGLYTINFTNAMPDANYTVASCGTSSANYRTAIDDISQAPQTTGVRIITQTGNGTDNDTPYGLFSIFR
jgi:hypothetical protein